MSDTPVTTSAPPATPNSAWGAGDTATPVQDKPRNLACVASAVFGSVFMGVTLPVLLVCYHNSNLNPIMKSAWDYVILIGYLEFLATVFCGPGAIILSVLLMIFMTRRRHRYADSHELVHASMWRGALISFLNFPGLLAGGLVASGPFVTALRLILMFVIAGGSSGAWVGWQVYRQTNPGTPFCPRYRLSTLMLLVFSWAVLLAIFAPSSKM
jgi:hypothetical protein